MSEKIRGRFRINKPALAGFWYTLSLFLERGAAVIFTPIYTRLLLPEEYGIYSLYSGFMGILSVFATLQITGNTVYRGLKDFSAHGSFIASSLGLISLSSAVSLALYLIFSKELNGITGLGTRVTLILFLQLFLDGIRALKISEAKYFYEHREVMLEGAFFALVPPILSILLIYTLPQAEYARIYGSLIASLVFTLPIIFKILRRGKFRLYSKTEWGFLVKYTLPILPHYISLAVIWQVGKIIVGLRFSTAEAAMLSLSISVGLLPSLLSSGMQSALVPWITRKLGEGEAGREKIYSLIGSAFFPLCIAVCLFLSLCPEVFKIMASSEYSPALSSVYLVAASVPIWFLINLLSPTIAYYKKTYFVTAGSVLGAVFNLIFNLLFTFRLGFAFSAGLILPTSIIILFVYCVILKRKFSHRELPALKLFLLAVLFFLMVALTLFLGVSLPARFFWSGALILILFSRLKRLKPLLA